MKKETTKLIKDYVKNNNIKNVEQENILDYCNSNYFLDGKNQNLIQSMLNSSYMNLFQNCFFEDLKLILNHSQINHQDKNNNTLLMDLLRDKNIRKVKNGLNANSFNELLIYIIDNSSVNLKNKKQNTALSIYLKQSTKNCLNSTLLHYLLNKCDIKPNLEQQNDLKTIIENNFIKKIGIDKQFILEQIKKDPDIFFKNIILDNHLNYRYLINFEKNQKFYKKTLDCLDWYQPKEILNSRSWLMQILKDLSNISGSKQNTRSPIFDDAYGLLNDFFDEILLKAHEKECQYVSYDNKSLIHYLCKFSNLDPDISFSDKALSHILKLSDINKQDEFGNTPLIYAVKSNNKSMVQLLIDNEADITIKNIQNKNVLSIALERQNIEKNPTTPAILKLLKIAENNTLQKTIKTTKKVKKNVL